MTMMIMRRVSRCFEVSRWSLLCLSENLKTVGSCTNVMSVCEDGRWRIKRDGCVWRDSGRCFGTDVSMDAAAPAVDASKVRINRMMYRARQRGWLELDLIVGSWAEKNVPGMNSQELEEFEALLNVENPDLFKWLTGQLDPPEDVLQNNAFQSVQKEVRASLQAHRSASAETRPGATWVRGWDDYKQNNK